MLLSPQSHLTRKPISIMSRPRKHLICPLSPSSLRSLPPGCNSSHSSYAPLTSNSLTVNTNIVLMSSTTNALYHQRLVPPTPCTTNALYHQRLVPPTPCTTNA